MAQHGIGNLHHHLSGEAIAKVLSSVGPVVKCVLLRATALKASTEAEAASGDAAKPTDDADDCDNNEKEEGDEKQQQVLVDLIDEIEVDTTPSKSRVAEVLGGSFTFLGQYDEEGIVLMVRKLDEDVEEILSSGDDGETLDSELLTEELQSLRLKDLKDKCTERGIDVGGLLEKGDLIRALRDSIQESFDQLPPLNPHQLQPPLDKFAIRGDILIMKVAETNEALDNDDDNDEETDVVVPTNDEFFLDYTKDEYIAFASRTDIVAREDIDEGEADEEEEVAEEGDDEGEDDEEEAEGDDDDEAYSPLDADGEFDAEEEKGAMLNFIMAEVLRKFREENGRGPDTRELLEIRSEIAERVGVEVASVDVHDTNWERKANRKKKVAVETSDENPVKSILTRKRSISDEESEGEEEPEAKKVKFAEGFEAEAKEEEV